MLCDSYDKQFYDSERNGKYYLIHARCVIIILKHCSFFIFLWIKIITVLPIRKKEIPCYAFISILWDNAILYRLLFLIRLYKGYLLHSIFFGQAFNEKSIKTYFSNLGCCVLTMHPIPVLILKLIFSLIKDLKLKILYLSSLLPLYFVASAYNLLVHVFCCCWSLTTSLMMKSFIIPFISGIPSSNTLNWACVCIFPLLL